jgi:hypothetical protein
VFVDLYDFRLFVVDNDGFRYFAEFDDLQMCVDFDGKLNY